jgi:hypothetical protein
MPFMPESIPLVPEGLILWRNICMMKATVYPSSGNRMSRSGEPGWDLSENGTAIDAVYGREEE